MLAGEPAVYRTQRAGDRGTGDQRSAADRFAPFAPVFRCASSARSQAGLAKSPATGSAPLGRSSTRWPSQLVGSDPVGEAGQMDRDGPRSGHPGVDRVAGIAISYPAGYGRLSPQDLSEGVAYALARVDPRRSSTRFFHRLPQVKRRRYRRYPGLHCDRSSPWAQVPPRSDARDRVLCRRQCPLAHGGSGAAGRATEDGGGWPPAAEGPPVSLGRTVGAGRANHQRDWRTRLRRRGDSEQPAKTSCRCAPWT